jgi:HAD superfamily hydrolase (TIGR01509 family)
LNWSAHRATNNFGEQPSSGTDQAGFLTMKVSHDSRWILSRDARSPEEVIALDGWRTVIRGPYPEPIDDLQALLGHNVMEREGRLQVSPERRFREYCLTRNISDPEEFLFDIAAYFGCTIPHDGLERFKYLVEFERNNLLLFWDAVHSLESLKEHGYKLALVSNTWVFPMERLKDHTPLGQLFDKWICSYDVNRPKPYGDIFQEIPRLFQVPPDRVVMVGDNLEHDVRPAMECGMNAIWVNRDGYALPPRRELPPVRTVKTLSELLIRDWRKEAVLGRGG